jgi:hypothetical protein
VRQSFPERVRIIFIHALRNSQPALSSRNGPAERSSWARIQRGKHRGNNRIVRDHSGVVNPWSYQYGIEISTTHRFGRRLNAVPLNDDPAGALVIRA